jgi:LPS O-antigen subunit length determinant protein (WzzB/FepE family)
VKHVSPHVAKKMVDDIVKLLNELMRDKDRDEAIRSLNFLNSQIANTSLTEMRLALADLIRQETQTLMLVEANEDYVFKMIDPPIASEIKSEPNRAYLCILYTFLGFMISIFLCLILFYKQSNHRT